MSIENSAASLLQRGVDLDMKNRYTEALICYQEGIQLLVDTLKGEVGEKRKYIRSKIEEYMNRAELIKKNIKKLKDEGQYHEQINIKDDAMGYSYLNVFGRFLDDDVVSVHVEDPYIRSFHQCQNFVRFCELFVTKCKNLKRIALTTSQEHDNSEQQRCYKELRNNLFKYSIDLFVTYSSTLHDRRIMLSTGWIIKIGRGLDYFKAPPSKFSLGVFDMNLRCCHETTIDVFHSNNVKEMP